MNRVLETLFCISNMKYVPSSENITNVPSRALTDIDCSLSDEAWARVQARFGPHTFDLMSLDSNCRKGRDGSLLPHYSPWPIPYSLGLNVSAQPIPIEHNPPIRAREAVAAILSRSAPAFRFYRRCPSSTPASLLVGNTPCYGSRFFSSWAQR